VSATQGGFVIPRCTVLSATALALVATLATAQPRFEQLRIVAPAAPGGGWDQTARAMQQVLLETGIATAPVVENVAGAAGTIGLARFIGAERGNGDALLVSGLIMLGGIVTQDSPVTLADVVPIARLTGEYEVLTVPTSSPLRTLDDLLRAFKNDPGSISWGGGSAGGSDHILAGLIAAAVGVEPRRVNYIAFSGGGEALAAIVGGQVTLGINGLAEFAAQIEAGTVRVLAVSSAERLPGLDAPTLREQGVDVELENWRSVVAPPGITADERARLEAAVAAMVSSAEWGELLARFRWLDRYLAGDELAAFTAAEERRVRATLRELDAHPPLPGHPRDGPRDHPPAAALHPRRAGGRALHAPGPGRRHRGRCAGAAHARRELRCSRRGGGALLARRARVRRAPRAARRHRRRRRGHRGLRAFYLRARPPATRGRARRLVVAAE
jgi:putative tricarboxylic transport membrane protein